MEIPVEKRNRRKIKLPGENKDDLLQQVKTNLYGCHDRLVNKLQALFDSMSHLQIVFAELSSQAILEETKGQVSKNLTFSIANTVQT